MNIEEIASCSLTNCHAKGLDSIVLDNTPGRRVRVFYATENHDLWRNAVPMEHKLSVAVHPHHCDITLMPLFGRIYNVVDDRLRGKPCFLDAFMYRSQITQGKGGFEPIFGATYLRLKPMRLQKAWPMPAEQLHTVYVPKGEEAAWYVLESTENPQYEPICFSNDDLTAFDFSELYQPMSIKRVEELLPKLGNPHKVVI